MTTHRLFRQLRTKPYTHSLWLDEQEERLIKDLAKYYDTSLSEVLRVGLKLLQEKRRHDQSICTYTEGEDEGDE